MFMRCDKNNNKNWLNKKIFNYILEYNKEQILLKSECIKTTSYSVINNYLNINMKLKKKIYNFFY